MVGVGGRSKACRACLRRRKACDLRQPSCGQCRRLGLECAWDKPQATFINSTVRTAPWGRRDVPQLSVAHQLYRNESLQLSAIQTHCLNHFFAIYLPGSRQVSPEVPVSSTARWITATGAAAGRSQDAMKLAVIAHSMCMFGIQHRDDVTLEEGRSLYGRALLHLAEGLKNPAEKTRLSLILTARLLGLFEIFFGRQDLGQGRAWTTHNSGERSLVIGGNPQLYVKGEAHQTFVDCRLHLTVPDLLSRRASIFGNLEWRTIPWQEIPKTPKDELLDIYVQLPEIFESIDILQQSSLEDKNEVLVLHLVRKCTQVIDHLKSWYSRVGSSTESLTTQMVTEQGKPTIEQMANAHLLVLYWCCILHYCEIQQNVLESGLLKAFTLIPLVEEDAQNICRNILRVIAIFLSPSSGWFGLNVATYPMTAVFMHIQRRGTIGATWEERNVLSELLQTTRGKTLSQFIHSLEGIHIASELLL